MNKKLLSLLEMTYMWDRIDSNNIYARFLGYKTIEYLDFQDKCIGKIGFITDVKYDKLVEHTVVYIRENK